MNKEREDRRSINLKLLPPVPCKLIRVTCIDMPNQKKQYFHGKKRVKYGPKVSTFTIFINSQDKSLTKELVDVAERTQQALAKLNDDDEQVLSMASLHLMAVSAIFTRCEKPDLELCSSFILSPKSNKKVASGWMKQTVFKFLKQFYDHFKDEVKELSSPPSWTDIVTASPEQDKSSRTSCFKLVMCAFSILNEVCQQFHKHGLEIYWVIAQTIEKH